MKFLFILLILTIVFALIAFRFRKQIQTALGVWRMLSQMQEKPKAKQIIEKTVNPIETQLVKCASCGTWTPQEKALNVGAKNFYCSTNCMENLVPR